MRREKFNERPRQETASQGKAKINRASLAEINALKSKPGGWKILIQLFTRRDSFTLVFSRSYFLYSSYSQDHLLTFFTALARILTAY